MIDIDRLRAWTYRRQLLGAPAADPAEALRGVIAVYSSHPSAPLSLLARSASFTPEWLADAEQRRQAVRLPAMRGSIHLLPAETAPQIFAATREPFEKFAKGALKYAKISLDEYGRLRQRASQILREPMAPDQAQEAFGMDSRITIALRTMAREGLVLRIGGSLRTDVLRYVWAEARLGHPLDEPAADESLRWLALEYLRAFGPARVKDFAWWAGIPQKRAAEALRDAPVIDCGGALLIREEDADAFASTEPLDPDAAAVLPKWDAYTMGLAPDGRARLLNDEHVPLAYSKAKTGRAGATSGDGNPLILRGGRAVAAWSHKFTGNRMQVEITPFQPGALDGVALEDRFDAIARLLGATSLQVGPAR